MVKKKKFSTKMHSHPIQQKFILATRPNLLETFAIVQVVAGKRKMARHGGIFGTFFLLFCSRNRNKKNFLHHNSCLSHCPQEMFLSTRCPKNGEKNLWDTLLPLVF